MKGVKGVKEVVCVLWYYHRRLWGRYYYHQRLWGRYYYHRRL